MTVAEKKLNDMIFADSNRLKSQYVNLSNLFQKKPALNVSNPKINTFSHRNTSVLSTVSSINTETTKMPSKTCTETIPTENDSISIKNFCRTRRKSLSNNFN